MLEKCREKAGLFVDCDRLIYCDDDPLVKKVMDEEFGDKGVVPGRSRTAVADSISSTLKRVTDRL